MVNIAKSHVEEAALAELSELGYFIANGPMIGPDTPASERENYGDVVLVGRLRSAIERLNPGLSPDVRSEILRAVLREETPSLIEENRRLHSYITEGVPVEVRRVDVRIGFLTIKYRMSA